ncbi:MAG TPA: hypothetical protein VFX22_03110, partial [Candidatus Kapabacteria bacterium]|nr:hypothetical protein [Candidatus Kapabacteria bacterium]
MSKAPSRNNPRKPAPRKPASSTTERHTFSLWASLASVVVLIAGLYRAIDLRWISDDAFITMRYVKNFVEGKGLVYNVGERVEGYTHFLWLMLLAGAKAIGFDPVDASIWLGIAAYAGILVLLLAMSRREHTKNSKTLWLPIAAALFALNYDAAVWASGGLETSFYTLLILTAFYLWFYSKFSERRRLSLTGVVLALVALTRPDGVLFTATAAALLIARGIKWRQSLSATSKSIGILLLPSVVVGVPYLLWKYFYYGDILPLTYYAKSAGENYFGQGFFYIWLYFRVYFVSAIAFLAALVLLFRKRNEHGLSPNDPHRGSPVISALSATLVYLVMFVARVGGDFMFARFIIPVVPFIYFVIEQGLERLPAKFPMYKTGVAVLLVASVLIAARLPVPGFFHINDDGKREEDWNLVAQGSTRFIADERWFYYDHFDLSNIQMSFMDVYSEVGKYLEPFFRDLPVTVAIPGAMNMIAYYANFSTCINEYGLTDAYIAHLPLSTRSHIGHEKKAPEDYLIRRNVDFELQGIVSEFPKQLGVTTIAFELPDLGKWWAARLVTYNKEAMNELARRFAAAGNRDAIPLFENLIPQYIKNAMPDYPLDRIEMDYAGLRQFYFNRYPDTTLERPFEERIAQLKRDSAEHSEPG